ncbi:MAG: alpha-amylase family glycosyl hydrolase [Methylacidiphilales bacterium]|nr:alpha-amylase family glycosyl hydrolase [Candidatus Methylacidiphilales bacterium]MDW8348830.1 alpha-amylase family glycosyl hydrolase [Verrucomicrobiae bacterium]
MKKVMKLALSFLVVGTICVRMSCSSFAEARKEPSVYLGWIPVQIISQGEPLVLDMRRFGVWGEDVDLRLDGAEGVSAKYDKSSRSLILTLEEGISGLIHGRILLEREKRVIGGGELTLSVVPKKRHEFIFDEKNTKGVRPQRVLAVGTFNGWNQSAHPLERGEDGIWRREVWLEPGEYKYKFVVDGEFISDPDNPLQTSDSFANSILKIEGQQEGTPPYIYPHELRKGEAIVKVVPGNSEINTIVAVAQHSNGATARLKVDRVGDEARVLIRGVPKESWIRVIVDDKEGRVSNTVRFPAGELKTWQWQDGVIYYAFTDRFFNGNTENDYRCDHPDLLPPANFHNGDLEGITKKIREGYFDRLGVNVLWLAPLNENPRGAFQSFKPPHRWYTGYHGYWPVSERRVEPRIGGEEALRRLVHVAHDRGIKVIADLVLKHVHEDHPWWKNHRDWFGTLELPDGRRNLRLWDEHPFTTWFEPFLPAFDFNKKEPVEALIENSIWWLEEFDLDGFRLDAVKHIQHDFWWRFRTAIRERVESKRKSPLYFVGETFMDRRGIMSFVGPNMLDAQFDFPLYDTIMEVFATEKATFRDLENSLRSSELIYGKETLMSALLGNHDKSRFMAFADGDLPDPEESDEEEVGWKKPPKMDHLDRYYRLKLGMSFLMTIDGVPMIYYGDEIGMTGAGDPDNRRMMRFGEELSEQEKQVQEHWSRVARIRHAHPALRYGHRRVVHLEDETYSYVRAYFQDRVLVAFNRKLSPATLTLDVAPEFSDGDYEELISGKTVKVENGKMVLEIPPQTSYIVGKR